jgi:8-oxo-dGTP pyrophosphatase MutT (NUDIX family)
MGQLESRFRGIKGSGVVPSGVIPAAVLAAFVDGIDGPELLLTRRSNQVRSHKREIAFPGGKQEDGDRDFLHTALRETKEELGINPESITTWGELEPIETSTGFGLIAYVGHWAGGSVTPEPSEVEEVIRPAIAGLLDSASIRDETRMIDGQPRTRSTYVYKGQIIWGATAQLITQMRDMLVDSPG